MKKKKIGVRVRQLICGQAKPGANLAFLKNMALFCKEFNDKTKEQTGKLVTVKLFLYNDGTYKYNIGSSPSTNLLKELAGDKKEITVEQLVKVTEQIMPIFNTDELERAQKIVAGTARSAGIKIVN